MKLLHAVREDMVSKLLVKITLEIMNRQRSITRRNILPLNEKKRC